MAEIIINPTPKQEFLLDAKSCTGHRNLFSTSGVQLSLRVALAQYQRRLADQKVMEGNIAAVNHFKSQGAHEFINTLMNLAEPERPVAARTTATQLDQKA